MSLRPRVDEILRTNARPTEAEIPEIVRIIAQGRADILNHESHIQRLEAEILSVAQNRDHALWSVNAGKAALHPIRSVPDDVLLDIFFLCSPLRDERWCGIMTRSDSSLDVCNAPWSFSQVCRKWRNACLSSRRLWSFVGVDVGGLAYMGALEEYRLRLYLERSGGLDLFVNLAVDTFASYNATSDNLRAIQESPLLDILTASAPRWKGLRIYLPRIILSNNLSGCSFDRLERLVTEEFRVSEIDAVESFSTAIHLRDVSILSYFGSRPGHAVRWPLPWAQITRYADDARISTSHLVGMEMLQSLHLHTNVLDVDGDKGRVELPSLTFMFMSCTFREPSNVFHCIATPSLSHLVVDAPYYYGTGFALPCPSPLYSLTTLELIRINIFEESATLKALFDFLLSTPNVTRLTISFPLSSEILQRLSRHEESELVLPHLKVLNIRDIGMVAAMDDDILAMLESRFSGVDASLERLETCTGFLDAKSRTSSQRWTAVCHAITVIPVGDDLQVEAAINDDDYCSEDDSDYSDSNLARNLDSICSTDSQSMYTTTIDIRSSESETEDSWSDST